MTIHPLYLITFFLNIIFSMREFFAVWDHIDNTKRLGKVPPFEDVFELWCAGILTIVTFVAFTIYCFR
jgi:hypothetical protein